MFKRFFSFFFDRSLLIFLIIGGLNTVVSMAGSFVLKAYCHWGLFASTAVMYVLCSIPSFYFNRKYSFQSKAPLGKSIFRFSAIITVCFLLSYSLNNLAMPWLRARFFPNLADIWYSLICIVGIQCVFTVLNYIGQRLWAFKEN